MSDQIINRLQKIEEKLTKLTERSRKIDDINKNVEAVYEKQIAFCERFEEALKEVGNLKRTVNFLESENVALKSEIKALRSSLEESFTTTRQCELEIVGISPIASEDLKAVCMKINDKLATGIKERDIQTVQRLSGRGGKVGNIHVRFSDVTLRNKFLTNARKHKLKCSDIGMTSSNNLIFINECLSGYSRSVLYATRQFKASNNWKYCWVRDGKIFLRKAEKEPAIRITCIGDLVILKK